MTSATTTFAPSLAKIVASLCPIPLAPPVMGATWPASLIRLSLNVPPVLVAHTARARSPARRRVSQRALTVYTAGRRARLWHHGCARCRSSRGWGPPAEARPQRKERIDGHVRPRSRRVSGRVDLETRRRPPPSRRASRVRAHARRLRRAPPSGPPGHHREHARTGNRPADVLRGSRTGRAGRDELGGHGHLQGGRAGARPDRAPRFRRRAGAD